MARPGSGCTAGAAVCASSSGAGKPVCGSQNTSAYPPPGSLPSLPATASGRARPASLAPGAALLAALPGLRFCARAAAAAAALPGARGCICPKRLGAGTAGRAGPSATRPVRRAAHMLCASPGRLPSSSLSSLLLQLAAPAPSRAGSEGRVDACATLAGGARGASGPLSSPLLLLLAALPSGTAGPAGASVTLASAA